VRGRKRVTAQGGRRTHEYIETGKEGDGGMAIAPGGGIASKMPKRRQKVGKGMVPKTAFVETP